MPPSAAPVHRSPLASPRHHRRTPSIALVDDTVAAAAVLVDTWHPNDSRGFSLFLDSPPLEAKAFLRAAADLHRAMLFFASDATNADTGGGGLVQAQALLDIAMRRLQLELELLLSVSVSTTSSLSNLNGAKPFVFDYDDDEDHGSFTGLHDRHAVADNIRAVAQTMMAAGYGKECVSTFKARRRAALAGDVQRLLGFSASPQHTQVNKLAWDQVDAKVQPWLAAANVAFRSLVPAERELCDGVFSGDPAVGDAVFAAIAGDQVTNLLSFAEAAVARARRAPERLFRVLDVHDALAGTVLPAVVSAFGDGSEAAAHACAALRKAGEAARGAVVSFEAAIRKEPSKAGAAAGGAVHPLTRYVMNYLVFLADYEDALAHIYQHKQHHHHGTTEFSDYSVSASVVVSGSPSPDISPPSPSLSLASNPIGWLVSVLLRKVEAKAGSYREAALGYLFLANNTHYVAKKVRGSGRMERILGEGWSEAQRAKARGYVDAYVRAAWGGKVVAAMAAAAASASSQGGGGVEEAVLEAVAAQEKWVAADVEMGEALRAAATAAVVPPYRLFYRRHGVAVRLTPGDVNAMIGGLFRGANFLTGLFG